MDIPFPYKYQAGGQKDKNSVNLVKLYFMNEKQLMTIEKLKKRIEENGESMLSYFNADGSDTRIDGSELQGVASYMCLHGYMKEKRDGHTYVMKDPNHQVSESVLQTNNNVRFSNRLSIGVAIGVGILTAVNVWIAYLDYHKAPDLSKKDLQEVVSPLVKEIQELKDSLLENISFSNMAEGPKTRIK